MVDAAPVGATLEELRARLAAADAAQDISPDQKLRLQDYLKSAIAALERIDTLRADSARIATETEQGPARRQEIKTALDTPIETFTPPEGGTLEDAEGKLRQADAALAEARQRATQFGTALADQRRRPEQLQKGIAEARERLTRIAAELAGPNPDGEAATVGDARRAALTARQRMRTAEVRAFEQELAAHDQRLVLLGAEQELAQRQATQLEQVVSAWRGVVQGFRQKQAASEARKAEEVEAAMTEMPPTLRKVAERNSELAAHVKTLTTREAKVNERLAAREARLQELEEDLASTRQRIELAGFNETLALVLRKQRDALPNSANYEARAREVRSETSWAAGVQIDMEDVRRRLTDAGAEATRLLDTAEPPLDDAVKDFVRPQLMELLRQRRDFAERLYEGSGRYIKQLGRLDNAERSLLSRAEALSALIDENLLWIRSAPALSPSSLGLTAEAIGELLPALSPAPLLEAAQSSLSLNPGRWVVGALLLVLAVAFQSRARSALTRLAEPIGRVRRDSISLTFRALLASGYLALAMPLLPAVLGWMLVDAEQEGPRAVGYGLVAVALIMLGFSVLIALLRREGVGGAHFGWPGGARHALQRQLRWLQPTVVALGFVIWATDEYDDHLHGTIGRLAFLFAMIALTVFIAKVFSPGGEVISAMLGRGGDGLLVRTRYLWSPAAIATPLGLGILSAWGYHYSAMQLQNRLQATAWLVIGLILIAEVLMRWVTLVQRRHALAAAQREREAAIAAAAERAESAEEDWAASADEIPPEIDEPVVEADEIRDQVGTVIRTAVGVCALLGLWLVWATVLPALNVLNEVSLWTAIEEIDGTPTVVPVTLVNLFAAILVGALAWVSTRNLPGALELAVLNRTGLDSGAKYAITTLSRYLLIGGGIVTVFNLLGMRWSQLQWLVAALSVGLGFGLQEIVANFVSGVILLFERPIRVGDVVTVGGKDGTVSRIQIRATTLTDWDRKEVVIPNKTFITGEVTNWTLTNAMNRILIPVGVSYGADTGKAMGLMMSIASEHPRILSDPAPIVTFDGFGDNALNLSVRCYMPSLDGRVGVITELCGAIDAAFREAGIGIPFPQRDVHLETSSPLEVRVVRDDVPPRSDG